MDCKWNKKLCCFELDNTSPDWPRNITCTNKLWLKGNPELLQKDGVCIVGTRNPNQKGRDDAKQAVDVLGQDYVIVSGLALGIDACAHLEALANGRPTIAVIGTPIDKYYPAEHKGLQQMIEQKGLVVSMYEPGSKTERWCFMKRNQLMAQIGLFSVVVQDGDRGGAVGQAKYTLKEGKPVFITNATYLDETLTWPHQLKGLTTVAQMAMIPKALEEALKTAAENKESNEPGKPGSRRHILQPDQSQQPELF